MTTTTTRGRASGPAARSIDTVRVIGYARVSTAGQSEDGASLDAQEHAIRARAELGGWEVLEVVREVGSGATVAHRPLLADILARLDRGEAESIVVARLDRLTRSTVDGGQLMQRAQRHGWDLVALDMGMDTRSPTGEAMAGMMIVMGQWERRMISERTKAGLAQRIREGVQVGPPLTDTPEARDARERLARMRDEGMSWREIARALNEGGVPTISGAGEWDHVKAYRAHKAAVRVADLARIRAERGEE